MSKAKPLMASHTVDRKQGEDLKAGEMATEPRFETGRS